MRWLKILYLVTGIGLFAWLVIESDLQGVWTQIYRVGWPGFFLVVLIYGVGFVIDTVSWQLTFNSVPLRVRWLWRLFVVRVIGESFNTVIPAGSMGGEPVKALYLKRRYQIGFRESGATLVLAKTINLLALVAFLCLGFVLLIESPLIPASLKMVAGAGLAALSTGTVLFFLVQRLSIFSWLSQRAEHWPPLRKLADLVGHIRDIDEHFVRFYSARRRRFVLALLLALMNWLIGTVEIYVVMWLLGAPVTVTEALIIESMVQLVRAGTFFIPGSIGAQEGAFVVTIHLLTGDADMGLAAALIKRSREIVWVAPGLLLAWWWPVRGGPVATDA